MNQSALIGGALLAGFALFITARDRLSVYGAILWGDKPASHDAPATGTDAPAASSGHSWSDLFDLGMPSLLDQFDLPAVPAIPDMGANGF